MAKEEKVTESAVKKAMAPAFNSLKNIENGISLISGQSTMGAEAKIEGARAEKAARKTAEKHTTLMESMVAGIKDINKSLVDGFKQKLKAGAGGLLAGLMAPVILLASFFKQLKAEFAIFKKLTGGGLRKIFSPLRNFLNSEKGIGKFFGDLTKKMNPKNWKWVKSLNPKNWGWVQKLQGFFRENKTFTNITEKLSETKGKFLKWIKSSGKIASKIFGWAGTIGKILGKVFLPITIVMSAYDFITGFMKGYEEDGIMGGLEKGLSDLFGGLLGMPLDLLTKGVAWIAEKFGFDQVSQSLTAFTEGGGFTGLIEKMTKGFFDVVNDVIGWIKNLFTDPKKVLQELWDKTLDKAKSIGGWIGNKVLTPITKFFVDTFTWSEKEMGEFDIMKSAKELLKDIGIWFGKLFDIDIGDWIKEMAAKLPGGEWILDKLSGAGKTISNVGSTVSDAASSVWNKIKNPFGGDEPVTPSTTQATPIKRQSAVVSRKRVVAVPSTARRIPQEFGAALKIPKSGVDWDFISKKEGGSQTDGYVPNPEGSKSGVTIATGFDLGARNVKSLEKSPMKDLPISLKTRLAPYMGLQGMVAKLFLDKNPLVISKSEAKLIDQMSKAQALSRLKKEWNDNAKWIKNGKKFDELSSAQQTVVASVAFQYGSLKKAPKFRDAAQTGRWDKVQGELRNFGDAYESRRVSEADYLVAARMNRSGQMMANLNNESSMLSRSQSGTTVIAPTVNNNTASQQTAVVTEPNAKDPFWNKEKS